MRPDRPLPRVRATLLLGLVGALLAGCGGGGGSSPTPVPTTCGGSAGPPVTITGIVRYQRLVLSPAGLGPSTELKSARFVDVEVITPSDGACWGATSTNASGAYTVVVAPPEGATLQVVVSSRTDHDPLRQLTVHNALPPGTNTHTNANVFSVASGTFPAADVDVSLTVPYGSSTSSRPSIGFGLLDVLATCSEAWRLGLGGVPPICHAYTQLGNNGAVGTSFYTHAARAIVILGGAAGNLDASDTDYFDDAVIAHEYHHFIEFNLSTSLSRGGAHGGEDLEPNFSWSEGQATGFGSLCRKDASYVDSIGTSSQAVGISQSVENWSQTVRGIGGEETVAELVYDLGDGIGGIPDTDGDGATVAFSALAQALDAWSPLADAPYVGLFLSDLVASGAITSPGVAALLATPENQLISWPLSGSDVWPVPIAVPGSDSSSVTSIGVLNPCRNRLASRWYVFDLAQTTSVTVSLDIQPDGAQDNLDLILLDVSGVVRGASGLPGASDEQVGPITLGAGRYLVRVEANCAGSGNAAAYTLTLSD